MREKMKRERRAGSWQECRAPVPSGLQPHDKTQTASKRHSPSSFTGLSLQEALAKPQQLAGHSLPPQHMQSTVNSGAGWRGGADALTSEYTPLSPCTAEEGVAIPIRMLNKKPGHVMLSHFSRV